MKRILSLVALLAVCTSLWAQEDEIVKDGWNFGPLPCVSYNSDLGVQFGVCADIFNYKGVYPDYRQRFYVEASSYYPSFQTLLHAQFDSKYLIPGIRTTFSASWQYDPYFQFFGFNGVEPFDPALFSNAETRTARYLYKRSMVRVLADFQGPIAGHLNWIGGLSYWYYGTSDLVNKDYDPENTLYHDFRQKGLIKDDEISGHRLEIKGGLAYDTRDNEAAPNRGIQAEVYLNGSPSFTGDGYNYLRLVAHFRHYITLWENRLVFAYHLGYQGTFGNAPFYTQQNISTLYLRQTSTDGLGGMNTVRGILVQRLVGNSYVWLNSELRLKLFSFKLFNQNFYVGINPLFDAGFLPTLYKGEELAAYYGTTVEDLKAKAILPHLSAGGGLKLAMNQNFIVSVEMAMPLNAFTYADGTRQTDGNEPALFVVLNYVF